MYNKNEAWHNFRKRKFLFLKRISKKPPSPPSPSLGYITVIPGLYTAAFSLFSFVARNSANSTSPRRRGPVQCRCSVGSERAPASHACLARARSRIGKRGPLPLSLSRRLASPVCIHLSLSLSLPLSLYPYLLSISLACICMYMCVSSSERLLLSKD